MRVDKSRLAGVSCSRNQSPCGVVVHPRLTLITRTTRIGLMRHTPCLSLSLTSHSIEEEKMVARSV